MPFKSKDQERYLFSQHPDIARRWAKETDNISSLPRRVLKRKKRRLSDELSRKY